MNLNNKDVEKYKNNGVIVLKQVFNGQEINFLKKKINSYIKKYKFKLKGKEINFINNKVNSIHKFKEKYFKKFSNQIKIKKIGNFFLNYNCKVKHFEYFAKPALVGLSSPMHQDNYYWNLKNPNALTIWVAIDKADEKNGTVNYLVGSQKKLYSHIASYAPGSSQKVKNLKLLKKKFKKKSFKLNPGDCLIHHSLIVHGSRNNKSKFSRRGFTVQLISKNAKVNMKRFLKYQKSLKKQIKLREKLN